jgi:Integrase core domain
MMGMSNAKSSFFTVTLRRSPRLTPNGHVESFSGKLREECLSVSWFENLCDARRKIAAWQDEFNEKRPHSALGYQTPAQFARQLLPSSGSALRQTKEPFHRLRMSYDPPCGSGGQIKLTQPRPAVFVIADSSGVAEGV